MLLGDRPLDQLSRREAARQIAVVPQETELAFEYRAIEIVLMGRHPHLGVFTVEGPDDIRIAQDALAATGTSHLAERFFHELSGGEKQRVVIAAALAQSAEPAAARRAHRVARSRLSARDLVAAAAAQPGARRHDGDLDARPESGGVDLPRADPDARRPGARGRSDRRRADAGQRQRLYDVEADVQINSETGHMTVVPVRLPRRSDSQGGGSMSIRRRIVTVVAAFTAFAIAVMIWAPTVGSTPISLARAFDRSIPWDDNVDAQIFFVARLPRVLAGGLVGATLAAAGVVLQALLRNPLATPFTLGVSAGASLGAMLAVTMRLELSVLGITSIPLASFAGSLVATGDRLCAGLVATARAVDERAAAGRRDAERVLFGADPVRAVPRRLRRGAARHPVDDGRARRRRATSPSSPRCPSSSSRLSRSR